MISGSRTGEIRQRGAKGIPQYADSVPVGGVLQRDDGKPSTGANLCYGIFMIIVTLLILGACIWVIVWCFKSRDEHDIMQQCLNFIKDCVDFIKLHIMIPDNDCNDGDPCTIDLCQDGGCSHKYVKPSTYMPCHEICHDDPEDKRGNPTRNGKAPLKEQAHMSTPRSIIDNGLCITGGVCEASTRCKGECTPGGGERKRDVSTPKTADGEEPQEHASKDGEKPKVPGSANRLELLNREDSRTHLEECDAAGCPRINFKPPFNNYGFNCICLGCGVCMWRLEIDLGDQTQGFIDSHCKNTKLLEKKCLDLVEHGFPEKECLVPAIRFCNKFEGKFVVECSLHYACAKATVIERFMGGG